ncbi:conjugal transfer protein TraF [Thorsellia kenyensis]|uniref:Conjugal transfer protein TraF n=1 Tax=Thorsellia kenyensis TaxID=1549888 RepID=A0ABV6CD78_9GAMM
MYLYSILFIAISILLKNDGPLANGIGQSQLTSSLPRGYTNEKENEINPRFFENHQQGWFWYKEQLVIDEEMDSVNSDNRMNANLTNEALELTDVQFSNEWFRDNLPKFLDAAIDVPTFDNIKTYLFLQKKMMDKSETFATLSQQVVMQHPELDERNRRPLAPFASKALDKIAQDNKEKLLIELSKKTGIYFFYRSDCPYCHIQAPILKALKEKFELTILAIALDGRPLPDNLFSEFIIDKGQAMALNVTSVPSLFLKGEDKLIPLSQGVLSYTELIDHILLIALSVNLITQEEYEATRALNLPVSQSILHAN